MSFEVKGEILCNSIYCSVVYCHQVLSTAKIEKKENFIQLRVSNWQHFNLSLMNILPIKCVVLDVPLLNNFYAHFRSDYREIALQ